MSGLQIANKITPSHTAKTATTTNAYFMNKIFNGRGDLTRTGDLSVPNAARYQLCYAPATVLYHKTPEFSRGFIDIRGPRPTGRGLGALRRNGIGFSASGLCYANREVEGTFCGETSLSWTTAYRVLGCQAQNNILPTSFSSPFRQSSSLISSFAKPKPSTYLTYTIIFYRIFSYRP